jgi:hypothetical protein
VTLRFSKGAAFASYLDHFERSHGPFELGQLPLGDFSSSPTPAVVCEPSSNYVSDSKSHSRILPFKIWREKDYKTNPCMLNTAILGRYALGALEG